MKANTKKQLERTVIFLLVVVFALGTVLLFLPISSSVPQPSPPLPPVDGATVQPAVPDTTGVPAP